MGVITHLILFAERCVSRDKPREQVGELLFCLIVAEKASQ